MNNPYILLRILILIDMGIAFFGMAIPTFRGISVLDFVFVVFELKGLEKFVHILVLLNMIVIGLSWIGLFMVKKWGRILYIIPMFITMIASFIRGNIGFNQGIFASMCDVSGYYYGFFAAMLFFGPISVLFKDRKIPNVEVPG